MTYQTEPTYTHGTPEKTGILLVNLGTPDAPTAQAVRPLSERIPERPARGGNSQADLVAHPERHHPQHAPEKIRCQIRQHLDERRLTATCPYRASKPCCCKAILGERTKAPFVVEYAMRYGNPSIASVLSKFKEQNCQRILIVPMYPQYAASYHRHGERHRVRRIATDAQHACPAHHQAFPR